MASREVRRLTVTVSIDIDADQIDLLPAVPADASLIAGLIPVSGAFDLENRIVDAVIRQSLEMLERSRIPSQLHDAVSSLSDRFIPVDPWEAFY